MLRAEGITKRFPGILANDQVDLRIEPGEIHGLVGDNGAGKTTLMKILVGLYQPDAGALRLDEREIGLRSPRDASACGIGMVHQHFSLVDSFTVLENVLLGYREPDDDRARLRALIDDFGLAIDIDAPVWQLSVGERQRVELLKLLYRRARFLILDEPTASLTPAEAELLFRMLRRLAAQGCGILISSHRLIELLSVVERITVMQRGRRVTTVDARAADPKSLSALMLGEDAAEDRPQAWQPDATAAVLACEGLCVSGDHGRQAVRDVTLSVHAGEILGVAGPAGNGQRELAEALMGLRRTDRGTVRLKNLDVTHSPTRTRLESGLRYIPADRHQKAIAPNLSVRDNLYLQCFAEARGAGSGAWLSHSAMAAHAQALIHKFAIVGCTAETPARFLSGGNLQKLVVARELTAARCAVIAESPTRGLDAAAARFLKNQLEAVARRGCGVLLISEDIEELLLLCHRVGVLMRGEMGSVLPRERASREQLGALMVGA